MYIFPHRNPHPRISTHTPSLSRITVQKRNNTVIFSYLQCMEIGLHGKIGVRVRLIVVLVVQDQDPEIVPCLKQIITAITVLVARQWSDRVQWSFLVLVSSSQGCCIIYSFVTKNSTIRGKFSYAILNYPVSVESSSMFVYVMSGNKKGTVKRYCKKM